MYEFRFGYQRPKYGENVKALLYGYRQLHCSCENRWYLKRHCRRCGKKIWHFKSWNRHTVTLRKNKGVTEPMKDELGGQIMKESFKLTAKTFSY